MGAYEMKWLVNSALTEYFFFSFREINRLDYQPLFGKMSPHSSPPEGAAGRVRFPLLVSANHVTTCRFSSGKDCRNETRSAELAIIISYPTSASGIIVLLKTPTKSRWISSTRTNRKRQGTSAIHMSHVYQNCQRANGLAWTAWMKNQNIVAMREQ